MKSSARQTSLDRIPGRLAVLLMLASLVSSCATPKSQSDGAYERQHDSVNNAWDRERTDYKFGGPFDSMGRNTNPAPGWEGLGGGMMGPRR